MKYSALAISTILASAYARPDINTNARLHARDVHAPRYAYARPGWNAQLRRREVPQQNAHMKYIITTGQMLNLDNPDGIVDPIFGLLGNAAGSAGQGSITDTDCLQQATADQAFTNAKAAGDVDGMTAALIYRTLERNTIKVGLASVPCTALEAVNPEIAALEQHQDPASEGAAQINFNIAINLAIQINCIGGDPTLALESGTFAPGDPNDPTAKGNSCEDQDDIEGCIYTQGLLVEDASVDDIMAAVSGAVCGDGAVAANATAAATGIYLNATAIDTAIALVTDHATAVDTAIAMVTDPAVAPPPPPAALPTECSVAPPPPPVAAVTPPAPADHAMGAAPPPPMGHEMTAGSPPPPTVGHDAAPPPPMGHEMTAGSPPPPTVGHDAAPPPPMGHDAGMGAPPPPPPMGHDVAPPPPEAMTGTSPAPSMITALPNDAGNVAIDCSVEIASALAAAGFGDIAANATATATATGVLSVTVSPTPAATDDAGAGDGAAGDLDFGTCPDPTIIFALGLDGREDPSFEPSDTTTFTHGSALNIKVITDFICQQMSVKCGANQAALDACGAGAQAAADEGGKDQGAADAFNAALGF